MTMDQMSSHANGTGLKINKTGPTLQNDYSRSFGNKRTEDVDMNLTEGYEKEVIRACKSRY